MILDFHHASFTVADMERSLKFYRDTLGMEFMYERDIDGGYIGNIVAYPNLKMKIVFLMGGGEKLELIQYLSPKGEAINPESYNSGTGHLAFTVDDVHEMRKRLVENGYKPRSEPVLIPQGPHSGWYAMYVYDPDGISIELMQPPKQA